jgi:hypothetical protein
VDGTVYGTADMSSDATVKADKDSGSLDVGLYKLLQVPGGRKAVENAVVTLKGYDWKVVPLLGTKTSSPEGKFKFRQVPARVAFFLDVTYLVGGRTYRQFGLVRTGIPGDSTVVEVDLASTLLSRYLLRLMQYCGTPNIANHPIDFRDLDVRDYKPMLDDLRAMLGNGMPNNIPCDLSRVGQPDGDWTLEKDKQDAAVVALDQLRAYDRSITPADRTSQLEYDVKRLADAVATNAKLFESPGKPLNIVPPTAF